jgi:hypothetical protein
MREKPNRDMNEDQQRSAEEFISAAEGPSEEKIQDSDPEGSTLPWEREKVREDLKQMYPLRIPEPLHLKLKFLSEKTGKSMNELCNEAVRNLIEDRLAEVLERNR